LNPLLEALVIVPPPPPLVWVVVWLLDVGGGADVALRAALGWLTDP
jgi:hypothetical protein